MARIEELRAQLRPNEVGGGPVRALLSPERNAYLDSRFVLFCETACELDLPRFESPLDLRARLMSSIIRREYRNQDWKFDPDQLPTSQALAGLVGTEGNVVHGNTTCNSNMKEMLTIEGLRERVRMSPKGQKGDMRWGDNTTVHGKLALTADGQVINYETGQVCDTLPKEGLPSRIITDPNAFVTIGTRYLLGRVRQFRQPQALGWHMDWMDERAELTANFYRWPEWMYGGKVESSIWDEALSRLLAAFVIEPIHFVFLSYDSGFRHAFPFFNRFFHDKDQHSLSINRSVDTVCEMRELIREWMGEKYGNEVSLLGNMMQMFSLRGSEFLN